MSTQQSDPKPPKAQNQLEGMFDGMEEEFAELVNKGKEILATFVFKAITGKHPGEPKSKDDEK